MFQLHPNLDRDCVVVGDLPLCRVLLSRDARYPWVILVPRRDDVREIYQLDRADRQQLSSESAALARALAAHFAADKMNVAALGNMVPQLHVHHIVRFHTDAAWPGPVWGVHPPLTYGEDALAKTVAAIENLIHNLEID